MKRWGIGIAGCGWIAGVHVDAIKMLPNASVVACCASSRESAARFMARKDLPRGAACRDLPVLLARDDVDVVIVAAPNRFHAEIALAALEAGKHVILEKPAALTLAECDAIAKAGPRVAYAEELCFAPGFVRLKERARGVRFVKQSEKHDGPHSAWFYDPALAGGGAAMDLGCHSVEFARWVLGKPRALAVTGHMGTWAHKGERARVEDHSIIHIEFDGGATALLEASWTLKGGMESRAELHGLDGVWRDEVPSDPALPDWSFQNGYPQEISHFLDCFERGATPSESIADGRAVLEIVLAAYQSAREGRRIAL